MLTSKLHETGECWYLAHPTDFMFFCGFSDDGQAQFSPDPNAEGVEAYFEEELASIFCYVVYQGVPLRVVQCIWSAEQTVIWKGIGDDQPA